MTPTKRLALALGLAAIAGCGAEQTVDVASPPQNLAKEPNPATVDAALNETPAVAARALEDLRAMAASGNTKMLGFDSAEQAKGATLGIPLPVLLVRLDQLRNYRSGMAPSEVWRATSPSVFYPVQAGDRMRCGITVARGKEGWAATSFGRDPVATLLMTSRKEQSPPEFIVSVPALSVYLAGKGSGAAVRLTPMQDYPAFGLKMEEAPAEQVLLKLVEPARQHNGLTF